MAEEIVRWCDWHLINKDERVPAQLRRVPLPGRSKKELVDLCDPCNQERIEVHIEAVRQLLDEYGRTENAKTPPITPGSTGGKRGRKPHPDNVISCPMPDKCGGYTAGTRTSMRTHFLDAHDVSLPVWEGRNGTSLEGNKIEFYCSGKVGQKKCEAGFTTSQGKASHEYSEHGIKKTA